MDMERMSNVGGYWIKEVWPRVEAHKHKGSDDATRWLEADGITSRRQASGSGKIVAILILVFLGLITLPRLVSAEGFAWNPEANTCFRLG